MKLEQHENEAAIEESSGEAAPSPSRRKFLRTSTTTALVTSLVAQPVWGQCQVSGAMSGGSKSNDDCLIPPPLFGAGRSPGFWSRAMYNGNAVTSAFFNFENSEKQALRCYIDDVKSANVFIIPGTPDFPEQMLTIADALSSPGGPAWNLAAIWLDAYFGFFGGVAVPGTTLSDPQAWVTHFFALFMLGGDDVFDLVFTGEPSTPWWTDLSTYGSC